MSHACVGMPGLRCVSDGHGTRTDSCNDEGLFRFLVGLAAFDPPYNGLKETGKDACPTAAFYFPALPGENFSRRPSVDLPAAARLRFFLVSAERRVMPISEVVIAALGACSISGTPLLRASIIVR